MVLENFDLPKSIDINRYLKKLFPINRSLTGIGNKQTIDILNKIVPLKIKELKANTQVYDWTIPPEWRITDGYIKNANGKKIVDWKNNNLSVLNYSMPVNKKVSVANVLNYLPTFLAFAQAEQVLTGAGAADITSAVTATVTDTDNSGNNAITLANGTTGQLKIVYLKTLTGSQTSVVTPANFANGTTFTLNAAGDTAILYFNGTNWVLIGGTSVAVA